MVSLFEKSKKLKTSSEKPMSINHKEFLTRIKKTFYYGPSNPNRMTSHPLAVHVSHSFNENHRNYSLNTLELDEISRIRQQTPCTLILAMIYLDRINLLDPAFVKLVSPSELFLVALMVSAKFYSDYDEMNVFTSAWAKEGKVDVERLAQLEIKFLNAIKWNILVRQNEFDEKLKTVEKLLAMKEGFNRGWFTYTELELLMPSLEIAKRFLDFTTILMLSYACIIATTAFSFFILSSIRSKTVMGPQSNSTELCGIHDNSLITIPTPIISIDTVTDISTSTDGFVVDTSRNKAINFSLFYHVIKWELEAGVHENLQLLPRKHDPVPYHCCNDSLSSWGNYLHESLSLLKLTKIENTEFFFTLMSCFIRIFAIYFVITKLFFERRNPLRKCSLLL
ncbi:CLUMA_CG005012, isoform A [Clunio marinus]|uniref:Protein CNPPD1 n=1 Tax=Clunio marinus TaxID=568069 RepID=A0A1J1HUW8_9DIPT|nr:CLUMA_CG005012, isoform A [Clunio marinus]